MGVIRTDGLRPFCFTPKKDLEEKTMKTILKTIAAVLVACLQIVAFYGLMPFIVANTMCEWRTWSVWKVTKFNVKAAAHTIRYDFMEWYR